MTTEVVSRTARWKMLAVAALCGLFVATSLSLVSDETGPWPWVGAAFFACGIGAAFWMGFARTATVVLDTTGVHFRQGGVSWLLRWTEITNVGISRIRTGGVTTQTNVVVTSRLGEHVISSGLTISPRRLAALIAQGRAGQGPAIDPP